MKEFVTVFIIYDSCGNRCAAHAEKYVPLFLTQKKSKEIMNESGNQTDIDFKAESIIPDTNVELKSAKVNKLGRLEVNINNQVFKIMER